MIKNNALDFICSRVRYLAVMLKTSIFVWESLDLSKKCSKKQNGENKICAKRRKFWATFIILDKTAQKC